MCYLCFGVVFVWHLFAQSVHTFKLICMKISQQKCLETLSGNQKREPLDGVITTAYQREQGLDRQRCRLEGPTIVVHSEAKQAHKANNVSWIILVNLCKW